MCVLVYACVHVRVRVCACVCVRVRVCVCACAGVRVPPPRIPRTPTCVHLAALQKALQAPQCSWARPPARKGGKSGRSCNNAAHSRQQPLLQLGCARIQTTTSHGPAPPMHSAAATAARMHASLSHGQPCWRAHCSTARWPACAAELHVTSSQGQPCCHAHRSTARWSPYAAMLHVILPHGQPRCRAH